MSWWWFRACTTLHNDNRMGNVFMNAGWYPKYKHVWNLTYKTKPSSHSRRATCLLIAVLAVVWCVLPTRMILMNNVSWGLQVILPLHYFLCLNLLHVFLIWATLRHLQSPTPLSTWIALSTATGLRKALLFAFGLWIEFASRDLSVQGQLKGMPS